jgi:hypothetical protein
MHRHWSQLLEWFDRPQMDDASGIPPVVVTRERARQARLYLEKHSGFDFEKFRESIQVDKLIHEPLGETPACLSAEALAEVVQSHMLESPATLDARLIAGAVSHIQNCEACFENIALYQEMEQRSLERALARDIEDLPAPVWIGPVGRVEFVGGPNAYLRLAMRYQQVQRPDLLGAMKARVLYPFDTGDVSLHQIEPFVEKAKSRLIPWPRITRRKLKEPGPEGFIEGHYCTDYPIEVERVRDQMCSFVSISQEIGSKEFHSTRIVRLEIGQNPCGT